MQAKRPIGLSVTGAVLLTLASSAGRIWAQTATKPAHSPALAASATALPKGASSINETYGDWTVACGIEGGQKICVLSQAQGNKQTGQRSFAIELKVPGTAGGALEGTILMPFGLNLDAGALLKLDDKDLGRGLRFSTCLAQGCLAPTTLPTVATDAMRKGKALTVAGLSLASGQAVVFTVALNGFGSALDRVTELSK